MYEGPINMICGELQMHLEGETLKAVQNVGVDVNKEELIKALNYDRNQYEKGHKDGYEFGIDKCIRIIEETAWRDTDMLVESIRALKGENK